jgi:alginate O-acetyltransferase complex protein AlgJ
LLDIMGIRGENKFHEKIPIFNLKGKAPNLISLPTNPYPAETVYIQNADSNNHLRALVFRDSFTTSMIQFISPHFNEVLYIWTPFDQGIVDRYKPDVVIECFVERYFQ